MEAKSAATRGEKQFKWACDFALPAVPGFAARKHRDFCPGCQKELALILMGIKEGAAPPAPALMNVINPQDKFTDGGGW